jgi:hypothetical protein
LLYQILLDLRIVDIDDFLHGGSVRKLDVVEKAATQKGVTQFLFIVAGNDNHRAMLGLSNVVIDAVNPFVT